MNKEENIINYLYQTWVNIKTMNSAAGQWQKTVAEEIFRSLCRKNNKLNCCYYLRYDSVFVKVYGQFIVYTLCPQPRAHKKNVYNVLNALKVSYLYIYIERERDYISEQKKLTYCVTFQMESKTYSLSDMIYICNDL